MVGSDCRRMFCRSRLMKTAATRSRSSLRPVSFSTIEASTMASSSDLRGKSFLRCAQAFSTTLRASACMRSTTAWRDMPRSTTKVSGSSDPSGGTASISPARFASAFSRSTICWLVRPSGIVTR